MNWMLTLFGTAIGAGVLFLPIDAGLGGIWPLIIMAVLAWPMTFLSHQALARFVLSSSRPGEDITVVAETFFGRNIGLLVILLYFFSILPIVMVYGVSITNTVDSFMVHQLQMEPVSRVWLSGGLIAIMMGVYYGGEKLLTTVTSWLVYPLAAILLFLSIYLIPEWNLAMFSAPTPSLGKMSSVIWITLPVIVFSFNHTPVISYFSLAMQRRYGDMAEPKASQIIFNNACVIWFFVLFFVFSCVLSLSPQDLLNAKQQNVSILSYLANTHESPLISYLAPIVAFCAIASSFFGHYAGTAEGLTALIMRVKKSENPRADDGAQTQSPVLKYGVPAGMFLVLWGCAVKNPSVLSVIESLSGPIIAAILFLMPMIAIHTVPALHKYAGKIGNIFIVITGLIAVSSAFIALLG
jgi:serine transporter